MPRGRSDLHGADAPWPSGEVEVTARQARQGGPPSSVQQRVLLDLGVLDHHGPPRDAAGAPRWPPPSAARPGRPLHRPTAPPAGRARRPPPRAAPRRGARTAGWPPPRPRTPSRPGRASAASARCSSTPVPARLRRAQAHASRSSSTAWTSRPGHLGGHGGGDRPGTGAQVDHHAVRRPPRAPPRSRSPRWSRSRGGGRTPPARRPGPGRGTARCRSGAAGAPARPGAPPAPPAPRARGPRAARPAPPSRGRGPAGARPAARRPRAARGTPACGQHPGGRAQRAAQVRAQLGGQVGRQAHPAPCAARRTRSARSASTADCTSGPIAPSSTASRVWLLYPVRWSETRFSG